MSGYLSLGKGAADKTKFFFAAGRRADFGNPPAVSL